MEGQLKGETLVSQGEWEEQELKREGKLQLCEVALKNKPDMMVCDGFTL